VRRGVPGRAGTSAASTAPAPWSPTSAWTRASTSHAQARHAQGRISKQGSPQARWALVEAAQSVVQQPGPLYVFYERIKARKGHNVAVARKLVVLLYCMLTREEDYAHQQPSLTAQKLRRVELAAGATVRKGQPSGVWATRERMRQAEKQLAAQAEASYKRSVADWKAASPKKQKAGASVTAGRA
jgi:transposase